MPQMSAGGRVLMVKSLDCMRRAAVPAGRLVVYLFGDAAEESANGSRRWAVGEGSPGGLLTAREVEVLRYLALGWDIEHIAVELGREPAHGTESLDEFASEAGREVEARGGNSRGADGRAHFR